jgi:uncharacterized LabA/DUF88 family protein
MQIDFEKLLVYFSRRGVITRAYYYTALQDTVEYNAVRSLTAYLEYNGYCIVSKTAKTFTDAFGVSRTKGNMDIEIAVDMLKLAPYLNHMYLFTGDGDFCYLLREIQGRGVRVSIVSTIGGTGTSVCSDELRRQADSFIDLSDIYNEIGRPRPHTGDPNE